ncbi:MAG: DUF2680 domain-containing protein [Peptococcaceae bacterium]|nr:DUF2680 domain-containing protein [Peptococcaceae bacterium]
MKRFIVLAVVGLLVLALVVPAAFAWAGNGNDPQAKNFFDWMFQQHRNWVDQAVKQGQITPEQGKAWKNHFDYMQKFHEQYGYYCPGMGMTGSMMGGMMRAPYGMYGTPNGTPSGMMRTPTGMMGTSW